MGTKTIGRFVYDSTTVSTLAAGDSIPLPSSTVSNRCISCDGTNITISRSGVYEISADLTFVATAADAIETQIYRNGNALPGAHAIDTATAIGNSTSQSINTVISVPCGVPTTVAVKALSATSVRIANVIVTKVA